MHARQGSYNRILLLLGNSKSPFFALPGTCMLALSFSQIGRKNYATK